MVGTCICEACKINRCLEHIIEKRNLNKREEWILNHLFMLWEVEATDSAYWEGKYKGTWPTMEKKQH